jgi:hypothetical protein
VVGVDVGGPRSAGVAIPAQAARVKGGCAGSVSDVVPADGGSGSRCAVNTGGRRLYAGNVSCATATAGTGFVGGAGNGNSPWRCGLDNAGDGRLGGDAGDGWRRGRSGRR